MSPKSSQTTRMIPSVDADLGTNHLLDVKMTIFRRPAAVNQQENSNQSSPRVKCSKAEEKLDTHEAEEPDNASEENAAQES